MALPAVSRVPYSSPVVGLYSVTGVSLPKRQVLSSLRDGECVDSGTNCKEYEKKLQRKSHFGSCVGGDGSNFRDPGSQRGSFIVSYTFILQDIRWGMCPFGTSFELIDIPGWLSRKIRRKQKITFPNTARAAS